jgi:hypothetical protein
MSRRRLLSPVLRSRMRAGLDEDMLGSILSLRRRGARTFNPPPRAAREEERTPGKNLHDLRPALYLAQKMGALLG